jgi:hypothetical protein
MFPCHEPTVQQLLHCAFDTPTRHCPATVLLEFVKYEIDHWHEAVAPSELTPEVPFEAWLTSRRETLVHDVVATASVQLVIVPLPQGTKSTGIELPATSRTVPFALRHVPPMHVWPAWQRLPHDPQLAPLVWRFTHAPAQLVSPLPHTRVQTPLTHDCPAAQALPQAPQLAVLDCRSTSQPSE